MDRLILRTNRSRVSLAFPVGGFVGGCCRRDPEGFVGLSCRGFRWRLLSGVSLAFAVGV